MLLFSTVNAVIDCSFNTSSKGVVYSHGIHINKFSVGYFEEKRKTLGSCLSTKLGNDYYCLMLQIGKGSYLQDTNVAGYNLFSDSLQKPPPLSVENFCLKAESDRFFYPTQNLPSSILTWRCILRESKDRYHFKLSSVKKRFDGIIFIRNSHALKVFENYPVANLSTYLARKTHELNERLKIYREKKNK